MHVLNVLHYCYHQIDSCRLMQADFFMHNLPEPAYSQDMTPKSLSEWHIDADSSVSSCGSDALWYLIKQYSPQDSHHATQLFVKLFKFVPTHNAAQSMNVKCDLKSQITDYFTSDAGMFDSAKYEHSKKITEYIHIAENDPMITPTLREGLCKDEHFMCLPETLECYIKVA